MWQNLGATLALVRAMRGQSQAAVARTAGLTKSRLSKYERGHELPRLDSLERVLNALGVGYQQFFSTLSIVDREKANPTPISDEPGPVTEELVVRLLNLAQR